MWNVVTPPVGARLAKYTRYVARTYLLALRETAKGKCCKSAGFSFQLNSQEKKLQVDMVE
jgi:hypothetical protein